MVLLSICEAIASDPPCCASSAAVNDALLSIRSSAPAARHIYNSFLIALQHGVKLFSPTDLEC